MTPKRVILGKARDELVLHYSDGSVAQLPAEYLRVESPSAEVRGHGAGQEILQIHFDDSHSTGIYSWEYLHQLWEEYDQRWADYLGRLRQAGRSRDPEEQVVRLIDPSRG